MAKTLSTLYLASQSPRRRELLSAVGLKFEVYVPKDPELIAPKTRGKQKPADIVKRIAKAKAHSAHSELHAVGKKTGTILSADTLVFLGQEVLGKPRDEKDARAMLKKLSGRTHTVATSVHILSFAKEKILSERTEVVLSQVTFHPISKYDLDWYIGTREPFDKAGAYGAQSFGSAFIKKFVGSYTNVVGLPVAETLQLLSRITKKPWQAYL